MANNATANNTATTDMVPTDIATIADEDTILGFKLAGVSQGAVFDERTVAESVARFKDVKVLIVTEQVAEHLRANDLLEGVTATLAEIPGKQGSTGAALKNIGRLLQEAIGVQLKDE